MEINWNIFKVKFNGKEQSSFERLAYNLFCWEFNKREGVFRFKNQTGNETEIIEVDGEKIGFQAKFFETKISDNKPKILDSIKKAKQKNPSQTKILLYLNDEFSESPKSEIKDPKYKIELETEAKKLGLTVEWRVKSHFEKQLSMPENKHLAEYYFSENNNITNFLEAIKDHTKNIFFGVQTDIKYNNQIIKIDRNSEIQQIKEAIPRKNIILICGDGGCGKTAVVKNLINEFSKNSPAYALKANDFESESVDAIFKRFGSYNLYDFINAHKCEAKKIFIIDSAERIADIENQEVFKEFLAGLIDNSWSIILTSRLVYIDHLKYIFLHLFRTTIEEVRIEKLQLPQLKTLSENYEFKLPKPKLQELIRNPIYLSEYLGNIDYLDGNLSYSKFKRIIWLQKIQNAQKTKNNYHIQREKCFLSLVKSKSEKNSFFIPPNNCSDEILSLLQNDEIIGYDQNTGKYFITHDIYEEWGLNEIIERTFNSTDDYNVFFKEITTSLVVRRAFRLWLFEKLSDNIEDVRTLITQIIEGEVVEQSWRDEVLAAILLSNHSKEFFTQFKQEILNNNYYYLMRICFLLRIACKEVDEIRMSNNKLLDTLDFNYIFTKPKGSGWSSTIEFLYENIDILSNDLLPNIVPVLLEWCQNNIKGKTTRNCGLIALKLLEMRGLFSSTENELIKITLYASHEIKEELAIIFKKILQEEKLNYDTPYFELCKYAISSEPETYYIIKALPEYILKIADRLWRDIKNEGDYSSGIRVEKYFGLNEYIAYKYSPASSYQSPIYNLLQVHFEGTIEFILSLTNHCVKCYNNSGFNDSIQKIELKKNGKVISKQFASNALWNMYRGTGSPVTPYLLQSIHMALEKTLIDLASSVDHQVMEKWLLYLIKKSDSTSITSVVASVVLAYPEKFFNVALILFSSIPLFHLDNSRKLEEGDIIKQFYSIGAGLSWKNKRFEQERFKSCEDRHRYFSLEDLTRKYQFFITNTEISEEIAEKRCEAIYKVIDSHLNNLNNVGVENSNHKQIRLLLARIDKRKMKPKIERVDDGFYVDFNPVVSPELKSFSEGAVQETNDKLKYFPLMNWARVCFYNYNKHAEYLKYSKNISLALTELKEIINRLEADEIDEEFTLYYSSTPAFVSAVIIRDFASQLEKNDIDICERIICSFSTIPLSEEYNYQILDGYKASIITIPHLIDLIPEKRNDYLFILLLTLFNSKPVEKNLCVFDYAIESILSKLWLDDVQSAQKILLAYIKYCKVFDDIKIDDAYGNHEYTYTEKSKIFIKEFEDQIYTHFSNPLDIIEFDAKKYSLIELLVILYYIPMDTHDKDLIDIMDMVITDFIKRLSSNDESKYSIIKQRAYCKSAHFLLFREKKELKKHIQPFIDNFSFSEDFEILIHELISCQDKAKQYDQFWIIWEAFYDKIKTIKSFSEYSRSIIKSYLLARPYWNKTSKGWHSLKEKETRFYDKVVKDIGHIPYVLDAIAQFLDEIGAQFINHGIYWLCDLVKKNSNSELNKNTVFYIECIMRNYIFINRQKVKADEMLKGKVLVILNFLVERGSVNGYLLREDIL